jgi:hypothetical protein
MLDQLQFEDNDVGANLVGGHDGRLSAGTRYDIVPSRQHRPGIRFRQDAIRFDE